MAPVLALALALLGAPAAGAALTDDVAAVVSDVGSVTEAPTRALPSLPASVETPDLPRVPAPVPLPSVSNPPSPPASPPPAPTAADADDAAGLDGGARGEVTRAPSEPEGPRPVPGSAAPGELGAHAEARLPGRGSIGPAETAPLRHWRAHVWPAIALRVGDAMAPLLARLDGLVAGQVPEVFGLLAPPANPVFAGDDLTSKSSGLLGEDLQSPPAAVLSEEGMGLLAALLIGLLMVVGLVALARLVVGEELFEGGHRPGHRG